MMIIRINEDGSASITAAGYMACYGKDGKLKMTVGDAPQYLVIHNAFKPKTKTYDAGMTLSVDAGITSDDHLRQIVREEIRQFVSRESGRGGLFSKW
ncbi:hypothetical protein Xbed_02846 [Xenorhabdus beddingii]|uniref:Uncharacterized protein n=1 Tax=Xenorhabdus beddingii TaxID=40578 RepID=A0A1Y2SJC7_9GAMM|nr:hypothetical protein [Xenorhabdus beddingii]OTA18860.1 hypothetical protein Xbed_02846 [Xenorhabdus beddingii]